MGDPIRLVMLKAVAAEIRSKDLLSQFRESGDVLLSGLRELEVQWSPLGTNGAEENVHIS